MYVHCKIMYIYIHERSVMIEREMHIKQHQKGGKEKRERCAHEKRKG